MKNSNAQQLELSKDAICFREETEVKLADASNDSKQRFWMVAYTGQVIPDHPYWGNLAIDLNGMQIGRQRKPVLREHDVERVVGYTDKLTTDPNRGLLAEGILTQATPDGVDVIALCQDDFPWQASMYIPPIEIEDVPADSTAQVNGYTLSGPGTIFRRSRVREVSFCVLGADENTNAVALSNDDESTINLNVTRYTTEKENKMSDEIVAEATDNTEQADVVAEDVTPVDAEAPIVPAEDKQDEPEPKQEEVAAEAQPQLSETVDRSEHIVELLKQAVGFGLVYDDVLNVFQDDKDTAIAKFKQMRLQKLQHDSTRPVGPDAEIEQPVNGVKEHIQFAKEYQAEHGGSITVALQKTAKAFEAQSKK